jgi:uncharacterized protein (TIGR02001 family)
MSASRTLVSLFGAASLSLFALAATASAQDADDYSTPPPPPTTPGFTYSFNLAGTSDYVFRGISQTDNDPTVQGGADIAYQMFYAGAWASGLDFGDAPGTTTGGDAQVEIDWYGGIKPSWNSPFGPMDLDFGVIYYTYPGANDPAGNLDYVELKAGYSWSPLHPKLTTGAIVYWSPDYTGGTGSVWTLESTAALELPKVHMFTPVLNGVIGWEKGDSNDGYAVNVNGTDDEYYYWNAGLALGVDNITFDFRYWDTNIGGDAGGLCGRKNLCDERFVFTGSVAVP